MTFLMYCTSVHVYRNLKSYYSRRGSFQAFQPVTISECFQTKFYTGKYVAISLFDVLFIMYSYIFSDFKRMLRLIFERPYPNIFSSVILSFTFMISFVNANRAAWILNGI